MKKGEKKDYKKNKSSIKLEINKLEKINIEKEGQKIYFEIINTNSILHTYDVAEGVAAILMSNHKIDKSFWNIKLNDKDKKEISTSKALYWLTGGNEEWIENLNYNIDWPDASIIFKKKFGSKITRIVKKAKTLDDIKNMFIKEFNLTNLYEFALENKMI